MGNFCFASVTNQMLSESCRLFGHFFIGRPWKPWMRQPHYIFRLWLAAFRFIKCQHGWGCLQLVKNLRSGSYPSSKFPSEHLALFRILLDLLAKFYEFWRILFDFSLFSGQTSASHGFEAVAGIDPLWHHSELQSTTLLELWRRCMSSTEPFWESRGRLVENMPFLINYQTASHLKTLSISTSNTCFF